MTQTEAGQKYFQLTHDYLVHSLRDWLTRKQKETRKGRAELRLYDTSVTWNAKPENRFLPSWWENLNIRLFTDKKKWTEPERRMMGKAGLVHGVRTTVASLLLVAASFIGVSIRNSVIESNRITRADVLVESLLNADIAQVPTVVSDIKDYREWVDPLLRAENDKATATSRQKLHASLALLPVDATQVDYLHGRLLDAEPHEVPVIRDALVPHKEALLDKLWGVVEAPIKGNESQRLRAAAALARYDPESAKWAKCSPLVVNDLVLENPVYLGQWNEAFRPVKNSLLVPLADIFRDRNPERTAERSLATNILADYAADQPQVLADLIMDADEKQFAVIYPKIKKQSELSLPFLTGEIEKELPPLLPSSDDGKEKLAKRQVNAAVALLRMNQPDNVWPLLKHTPDPRVRSYLIHRLNPMGVGGEAIVKRLHEEPNITIRRALFLSLGEYGAKDLSPEDREAALAKAQAIYRTDADPGLHGAAEWLLRTWKEEEWLKQVNEEWAKDWEQQDKRIEGIQQLVNKHKEKTLPQWYVNGQGQTMVVIPGPVEFMMGSPLTEMDRQEDEPQHNKRIGRTFAIAAKSVTVEQYRQFADDYPVSGSFTRTADLPVVAINWFMAARYCNWLSKEEGIADDQCCYEIKGNNVKLTENYLSLTGYRLPTEAEMEYATRAGSLTSRYFGETDELLPKYAWYNKNSQETTWPVGSLKPNDWGLFDVQGNVFTWCQESYTTYPDGEADALNEDKEDASIVMPAQRRTLRGGSFVYPASNTRSANRSNLAPRDQHYIYGFRLARTVSPLPVAPLPPSP